MSRLRFDRSCAAIAAALLLCGCGSGGISASGGAEWRMFGGGPQRTSFNSEEHVITPQNAGQLIPRWRFLTGAIATAAPVVAHVDLPGEGSVQAVFEASWDGNFYALRADDGTLIWSYRFKPHPGSEFVQGASAAVDDIDGRRVVFVGNGETMYCLDAATGELLWQFDAGTGCTDCDRATERNELLSPPVSYGGALYFGMDVNQLESEKGGFFALDARTGVLRWYFDLQTGSTCRPNPDDQIRRFDGFHSAESLGLPPDFLTTREGCDFNRTGDGCGSVYGGAAIDAERGLLYAASNNCDAGTGQPPVTPKYDEAIFALTLDGKPVWSWRPREFDPDDLDFGSTPNLFEATIAGERRDVVGIGSKDGTYYVLDRDGVNQLTGAIEPYWGRNVVPGGADGGIIASSAVAGDRVLFSTAFGGDDNGPLDYQKPAAWGLDTASGDVVWSNPDALASFSPTFAVPGIALMGSFAGFVYAYDMNTGERLAQINALGPLYSQAVVVDGQLYVGAGSGAHEAGPEDVAYVVSEIPSPLSAFCVEGTEGCPASGVCIDGNPCTADGMRSDGHCDNSNLPNGADCRVGAFTGQCQSGTCQLADRDCDDHNQCTQDALAGSKCIYSSEPPGTPCTVASAAGECANGVCQVPRG